MGKEAEEVVLSSNIHGWRAFSFGRCERVPDVPILLGAARTHLHQRVQEAAKCTGIAGAKWMTNKARERSLAAKDNTPPHEGPAPDWDCTCGAYFYRLLKDCYTSPTMVYAHVTCMERTILHQNGGRTTQYSVDYLLASEAHDGQVALLLYDYDEDTTLAKSLVVPLHFGYVGGGGMMAELVNYGESLTQVANHLDVPVLSKSDLAGCPQCLVANGWVAPEVITETMRKDWFGAGYHE